MWPASVTGDTITWQGPLTDQAYDLYLDVPASERGKPALTVGHIGALHATRFWHASQPVSFTPPKVLKACDEISFLCEDYGNTSRSELFDTTGHSESGVDPRTGLFHAHYPVASLQGLQGQGPAVDLTLHYSALRANEAGLGDGWAWRFASVQLRDKLLTLADGAQVQFTDAQWTQLGKGKSIKLPSCVVSSNADYSQFILDLPSGRQEVLEKPSAKGSDDEEPNKKFHDQVVKALEKIRDQSHPDLSLLPEDVLGKVKGVLVLITPGVQTFYGQAATWDFNDAVKKWRSDEYIIKLKKIIADYQKPFVLLLPSTIESPYGEQVTLEWKRQKGQFLLLQIKSGDEPLFKADYVTPQEKTAQVNMQVWPQSKTEQYEVKLELKDYLLRTLRREQNGRELQQVDCDYDDDPTLDRVLCSLRELDGSVECVKYQPWQAKYATQKDQRPGLPRVALHTLVPGDGQENQVATYRYDGDFLAPDQRVVSVEYESGVHAAREHHLLVHGNVMHSDRLVRFELLRGVASGQDHWLAFSTQETEEENDQRRVTKGYRYTGVGDEFAELLHGLEAGANKGTVKLKLERQKALRKWFFRHSQRAHRPKLAACITRMVAHIPPAERDALGRTVEVATHGEDKAGNVLWLHKSDEHRLYRCYYTEAGGNLFTPKDATGLKGVEGLGNLPALNCPFIPAHASLPVMAEYQCDPFGNPQGLRLFGFNKVTRGSRELLELSEVVTVEGVKGTLTNDRLDATATWALADSPARLLWRQRSIEITVVTPKATPSGESKVKQWSVKDTQRSYLGAQMFKLESVQHFEDNPTNDGIVVRVTSSTEHGSELVSNVQRSRHGWRCLGRLEPGTQVRWQYDALGRVTQEKRYRLKKDATGQYLNKDKDQQPDEQIDTVYSLDGKVAMHTHANQDISRSCLDGLQRAWGHEWRKHGTPHYVPVAQYSLQGLDTSQRVASCEWDYLPGGQAVVAMAPQVSAVGPQTWVREQGGLDGPGTRARLEEEKEEEEAANAQVPAPDVFSLEPFADQDILSKRIVEEGFDDHSLYQRTLDYIYCKDGTFEQVEHVTDGAGQAQLQVRQRFDDSGAVIAYGRTVGGKTRVYNLERDAVGRVTKVTRPDRSTVEYRYHGLSNHATELKVDGRVVATQTVNNPSTLTSRTVGGRAYSFMDDSVTLPDKTTLTTPRNAEGLRFKVDDRTLSSLTENDDTLTLASAASDAALKTDWAQTYRSASLPGRQWVAQTSPRAKRQGCRWLSLHGRPLASLRADGHWQRVFSDEQGRVLRTCQDHEEVVYRYDAQGRLQSRQAQALKAGGQWQVLSAHDGFGQEVTRRFLHNGNECFKQCLTWRGDGRLTSKASYERGTLLRAERFTYDVLDRLQRYECEADKAEHCPQDAHGTAVKAQDFSWDALSNLTRCVTTGFDGTTQTEELAYATSDPTRLTRITRGQDQRALAWNSNGYLTDDADHGREHRFSYNAAGQLDKVSDSAGQLLARYEYDGSQRLVAQYLKGDESTRELRYNGDELIGEIRYDKAGKVSQTTSLSSGLAQYDDNEVRWLINDANAGVAGQFKDGALELAPLLPFGDGKALEGLVAGYNGMRRDPLTGHYHAGNGYRSYDPTLRRYAQPDWLSPFGEGGLNDYAHCPDPINLHDPSGAIMLSRWDQNHQLATYEQALQDTQKMKVGSRWRDLAFSLTLAVAGGALTVFNGGLTMAMLAFVTAMSVASFAFEVASVLTEESNPGLSKALGIVSVVTGALSCLGFAGVMKSGFKGLQFAHKGAKLIGNGAKVGSAASRVGSAGSRVGSAGSRVGSAGSRAGRAGQIADNALGSLYVPRTVSGFIGPQNVGALSRFKYNYLDPAAQWLARNGLNGARKRAWSYLTAPVEIAEQPTSTSGWLGGIGNYFRSSLATPGTSRLGSLAIYVTSTTIESYILYSTIDSSISLAQKKEATVSARGGGGHEPVKVPKLPSLSIVQHDLPVATHGVRFW